ncbi:aldehyde dehydrogenase (NADP(+)) [Pseudoalteromonas xiamenensis]
MLSGKSFIAGIWQGDATNGVFNAFSPSQNCALETPFFNATELMVADAINQAQRAFIEYRQTTREQKSAFLNCIADEIEKLGDKLLETTHQETNLPMMRLQGERGRTVNQLRFFASELGKENNVLYRLREFDQAEPDRAPLPKPQLELDYLPVGVVAVFGASNFPYAFSTAGGDTASALAAGCPVVMKSHTAHPGTSELITRAIEAAIKKCNMPKGVFSMIQAKHYEISHQLVAHPFVKAVGFTGSLNVAKKLIETINQRTEAIPFYGELGSVNPQFVLSARIDDAQTGLGHALVQSMLMGNGQFCTSPGVWLIHSREARLIDEIKESIEASKSDTLLTPAIVSSYKSAIEARLKLNNVSLLAKGLEVESFHATPHVFKTDLETYLETKALHEEVFGPQAVIVTYQDEAELFQFVSQLEGQLTASVHGNELAISRNQALIERLQYAVGRLIFNQMPTGVEVCCSMNHGGPFPSSSDVRSTSVGSGALLRFVRPICYQGR